MSLSPRRAVPVVLQPPAPSVVTASEGARVLVMPLTLMPLLTPPPGLTVADASGAETAVVIDAPIALEYVVEALIA